MSGSGMIEYLMDRPELVLKLPKEMQEQLLAVVRAELARVRNTNAMPSSAVAACVGAVDNKLMADIVADARRSNDPGFLKPDEKANAVVRGSGWSPLNPVGPPPGIKYVDQLCDVQDALDRKEREKHFKG